MDISIRFCKLFYPAFIAAKLEVASLIARIFKQPIFVAVFVLIAKRRAAFFTRARTMRSIAGVNILC